MRIDRPPGGQLPPHPAQGLFGEALHRLSHVRSRPGDLCVHRAVCGRRQADDVELADRRRRRQHLPRRSRPRRAWSERLPTTWACWRRSSTRLALQDALEKAASPRACMSGDRDARRSPSPTSAGARCATSRRAASVILAAGPAIRTSRPTRRPRLRAVEMAPRCCSRPRRSTASTRADPREPRTTPRRADVLEQVVRRPRVLDSTASACAWTTSLPIIVFDLNQPDDIRRAALGGPGRHAHPRRRTHDVSDEVPSDHRCAGCRERSRPWSATSVGAHRPRLDGSRGAPSRSTTTAFARRSTAGRASASRKRTSIVIQPWDRSMLGADREGHPEVRPGHQSQQRRASHPPGAAAADRRAPQGAGQAGAPPNRGIARCRPQRQA